MILVQVCHSLYPLSHNRFFSSTYIGDVRIIIFSSDEQINILQSTHHFLADGTFKVVPEMFYQLYIIHTIYRDHVFSVMYPLLRRKDTGTYRQLINEILKFAPQWTPHSIMIDFEKTCINVYEEIFPNIAVSSCYFHPQQNLYRKLQPSQTKNFKKRVKTAYNFNEKIIVGSEHLNAFIMRFQFQLVKYRLQF